MKEIVTQRDGESLKDFQIRYEAKRAFLQYKHDTTVTITEIGNGSGKSRWKKSFKVVTLHIHLKGEK